MRLLLCIDHFGSGGAQRQLVNLAAELKRRGHIVEFFIYHPEFDHFRGDVKALGADIFEITKGRRFSVAPVTALARHLRSSRPDAVVAFLPTPSIYVELAGLFARTVPTIVSERFMYTKLSPTLRIQQQMHRLATRITVNSHHQQSRMVSNFPWMAKKLSVIYNGVDLERFRPGAQRRQGDTPLNLLAVGNTAPKKNALGVARSLARLRDGGFTVPTVAWAGAPGAAADTQARDEVNTFLTSEELHDHWTWLGRRDDVPDLMRSYDALIHPAFYEGLPNAICEALACGLPVLASDVGDHRNLVGNDRGVLFDPHDPGSIAQAISTFTSKPTDEKLAMSQRARIFAEKRLSMDAFGAEYERLINEVVAAGPSRAHTVGAM